jgi:alkylation response protein AidB-like acyl-CoA dehydrogenase
MGTKFVSHEARNWVSYEALANLAGARAAERDHDGCFPDEAFTGLRRLGLLGNPPLRADEASQLFRALAAVGRGDLSVGRIFEGHINALLLIRLFATEEQRRHYQTVASGGSLFGVWNTDLPGDPLLLEDGQLRGKKNFASGVDGLSHAIVTVPTSRGRQLVIVPAAELKIDRSWWHPLGMRASGSHVVDFEGVTVNAESFIGGPDDYLKEPWFSGGGIRFSAVHVGGMHAVLDTAVSHLKLVRRSADPYQLHRIGQMAISVGTGYAWLDQASRCWAKIDQISHASLIASMSAARTAIERAALNVLELAERSVGAAGMIAPHPLERQLRDLRTYLRQPNPDGALAAVGAAVAGGLWAPGNEDGF